jgi:hypothetical protein
MLRAELGELLAYYGYNDLDVATVRGADRRITRRIGRWAYEQRDANDRLLFNIRYEQGTQEDFCADVLSQLSEAATKGLDSVRRADVEGSRLPRCLASRSWRLPHCKMLPNSCRDANRAGRMSWADMQLSVSSIGRPLLRSRSIAGD